MTTFPISNSLVKPFYNPDIEKKVKSFCHEWEGKLRQEGMIIPPLPNPVPPLKPSYKPEYWGNVMDLCDKLEGELGSLPRVDENGNSDCPFARRLYDQVVQIAKELEEKMGSLRNELRKIDQEIAQLKLTIETVTGNAGLIQRNAVADHFVQAQWTGQEKLQVLLDKRMNGLQALARAESLLQKAQQKKWPGPPCSPSAIPGFPPVDVPNPWGIRISRWFLASYHPHPTIFLFPLSLHRRGETPGCQSPDPAFQRVYRIP